jgi:hypothetical protein
MDSDINKVNPLHHLIDIIDEDWSKDCLSDDGFNF